MQVQANGITIHYTKQGSGKPLILLHGNGEDHHIFDELATKLKDHFTIYAIDSRNHGKSSPTDDYSYETMASDIIALKEALGLEKPSILGFSDGAIIALIIAMQDDLFFEKMILLGVNLKPSDFTDESMAYLQEEYKTSQDPLIKLMLEEPNIELSDLANISSPTLLIAAENDIFKAELYHQIEKTIPDATLRIMEGHDHGSYIINEDILYSDIVNFLE